MLSIGIMMMIALMDRYVSIDVMMMIAMMDVPPCYLLALVLVYNEQWCEWLGDVNDAIMTMTNTEKPCYWWLLSMAGNHQRHSHMTSWRHLVWWKFILFYRWNSKLIFKPAIYVYLYSDDMLVVADTD